jgi:hypothetical protein
MPIIAKDDGGTTFQPAPEGMHQAVCVDVIDKGLVPNAFKPGAMQHKVSLAWQIDATRDDGKRYLVYKRYTLSLNEKATLRHDLESWRGRAFTVDELKGFDVETVIGANALLNLQHRESSGKTFANVMAVSPLIKGMAKLTAVDDYVRERDRTEAEKEPHPEEDTVPF